MRITKYIIVTILLMIGLLACEKNVVEYNSRAIGELAEFQLHTYAPVIVNDSNIITRVEINGQLYTNSTAPLSTYNAIPNGSVGKFFTTNVGNNNIKMYKNIYILGKKTDNLKVIYDQNCDLKLGKQNIFVYDFSKPPIIFDNGFPYTTNVTANTDSTAWIKFYNFLYETSGVPTSLKIQYQYQYPMKYDDKGVVILKSDWTNIGKPVSFGETTGWIPVVVKKSIYNSAGYARLDYKIKVIDNAGNIVGDLQIMNTNGAYISYADYWNGYVGRRYHHVLSGMRAVKIPAAAVRQFTAL